MQLSENSLKEKRKQKLMKANSDARKIQKAQRMEEKRLKEEEAVREQDERDRDLGAWSNKMRTQHEVCTRLLSPCGMCLCLMSTTILMRPIVGDNAEDANPKTTEGGFTG
jgi:hypothetical protein